MQTLRSCPSRVIDCNACTLNPMDCTPLSPCFCRAVDVHEFSQSNLRIPKKLRRPPSEATVQRSVNTHATQRTQQSEETAQTTHRAREASADLARASARPRGPTPPLTDCALLCLRLPVCLFPLPSPLPPLTTWLRSILRMRTSPRRPVPPSSTSRWTSKTSGHTAAQRNARRRLAARRQSDQWSASTCANKHGALTSDFLLLLVSVCSVQCKELEQPSPLQASLCRKNVFVIMCDNPCKVRTEKNQSHAAERGANKRAASAE